MTWKDREMAWYNMWYNIQKDLKMIKITIHSFHFFYIWCQNSTFSFKKKKGLHRIILELQVISLSCSSPTAAS